jgi:hypothetical protein
MGEKKKKQRNGMVKNGKEGKRQKTAERKEENKNSDEREGKG